MMFQPPLQIEILLHPSAAGIQNQAGKLQGLPILQILFDQNLPLLRKLRGNPGIPISRKIDEIHSSIDPIKINRLCSTRCVTRESQLSLAGKGVDQAGLSYVTSP